MIAGVPHTDKEEAVLVWPNGDYYRGEFKHGKRHGKGKRVNKDGSCYTGQYEEDQPSGKGIITWGDGETYEGEWKNGKYHGKGKKILSD